MKIENKIVKEFISKWRTIGLCTEPANRKLAEEGICMAYESSGNKIPKNIIWCNSPFEIVRKTEIEDINESLYNSVVLHNHVTTEDYLKKSVEFKIWNDAYNILVDTQDKSTFSSIRTCIRGNLKKYLSYYCDFLYRSGNGQDYSDWLCLYDYFIEVYGLKEKNKNIRGIFQISKNAGWWMAYKDTCWISERHNIIKINSDGKVHADGEMAIQYPDGWGVYAFDGIRIPEKYGLVKHHKWESNWIISEEYEMY